LRPYLPRQVSQCDRLINSNSEIAQSGNSHSRTLTFRFTFLDTRSK
jgi:hypothetical protein